MTINPVQMNIEVVPTVKNTIEKEVKAYTYRVHHANGVTRQRTATFETRQKANNAVKRFIKYCVDQEAKGVIKWFPFQDGEGKDMWTIINDIDQSTCQF